MSEYKTDSFLPCDEAPAQMSKRFYAACCAMQGLCVGKDPSNIRMGKYVDITELSFIIADELLRQEQLKL